MRDWQADAGALPDTTHAKDIEAPVIAEHGNITRNRLGSDHSIERIAVGALETAGTKCVTHFDCQQNIAGILSNVEEVPL
jgi:hypothetical protein